MQIEREREKEEKLNRRNFLYRTPYYDAGLAQELLEYKTAKTMASTKISNHNLITRKPNSRKKFARRDWQGAWGHKQAHNTYGTNVARIREQLRSHVLHE